MSSRRYIFLPPGTTNPGAVVSGVQPIQVFVDSIDSLFWDGVGDGTGKVNVGLGGTPDAVQLPVTDAIDAMATLSQINYAIAATGVGIVITGNPAVPGQPSALGLDANLAVSGLDYGQCFLTWTPTGKRASSYNILRSDDGGATFPVIGTATTNIYNDTSLVVGTTYQYKVVAVSVRGQSDASDVYAGVTTLVPGTPAASLVVGYNQITVNWGAISPAGGSQFAYASYNVYRGAVGGGPYSLIASGVSSLSLNDSQLIAGQFYEYVVTATINNSESAYSNAPNATPNALGAPTIFISSQPYSIGLSWAAVTGATSYNIYRGTVSGGETLINTTYDATYQDSPLPIGQDYFYYVKAVAGNVEGPQSNEVSATPANATFSGVSPQPASIAGGVLTFTGIGFDPVQGGQMAFGIAQESVLPVTYIDYGTIQVYYPGGFTPGSVQFYYLVAGSYYELPFTVAFA